MKKIQLLILFLFLYHFSFSQSACENKTKLETLIAKEVQKHGDRYQALERAKFYWWRRCQCESEQVSDPAGEQTIIKYLATGYDNFIPYKGKYADIPKPTQRNFKLGECYSSSEPNVTITYGLDCTPAAKSFLQSAKDPQQYGKAFFSAYCECNTGGVATEERAKQLEATMIENHKNYHAYKTNVEPSITVQPLKANKCLVNSGNPNSGETYTDPNAGLKSATLDFMNELASNTEDERVQQTTKNLNNIDEWIDVFKTIDPDNSEGFDEIENIAMGIGIIHGLFKKPKEQNAPKKQYQLQDGSFVMMTDEEVRESGIKILLTPNIEPSDIKNELLIRSKVSKHYEKRLNILYELYTLTNKIDKVKVEEIKLKIYKNYRENNSQDLEKSWIQLYELFDLPKVQNLISELKKSEEELEIILRQIYIIQKEIYLQLHYDINQPKWTKEEILDFYNDLQNFSDKEKPYMTTFDNPNSYSYKDEMFHELCPSVFVKNELSKKYNYIISQDYSISYILKIAHEGSGMTRLLPILLFHKSDKTALDYIEFLLEERIFNSPFDTPLKAETTGVGYPYYFLLENCSNVKASNVYNDKNDSLFQLNQEKYRIAVTEFCPFNKENRANYLERLDVNFKYSWQTDFNIVETQIKSFSEKPTKDYEKQKKNQNKIGLQTGWTGLLEDFFSYSFLFYDIKTERLDKSYLTKVNELIQVLETPYNLINLDPNYTLSSFLADKTLPFSRLYIFRYFLEKTNNVTTHTQHDKKYILDNYFGVLQDYYRFEKNTDALNFVLQDINR